MTEQTPIAVVEPIDLREVGAADPFSHMEYRYWGFDDPEIPLLHINILHQALSGITEHKTIAQMFRCNPQTVARVFKHGPYRKWICEKLDDLYHKRFAGMVEMQDAFLEAAQRLRALMRSDDDRVSLAAVQTYIKTIGVGLPEAPKPDRDGPSIDPTEIEDMRKAAEL